MMTEELVTETDTECLTECPVVPKFARVNNIMRVATIIYNATVDHVPMWQGRLLDTLYFHVSENDVIDAIDFLSDDGMIVKQYGDDGYGNQVVLLTFNPDYMHDYMHLLLDIAPKYEDDEPFTFPLADKIAGVVARIKAKLSARKNNQ